ncbi:hypothetical protein IFM61606_02305 [Aspergillus udagawae]|nr:hypothetical protein IFM61606_02305 [Aspergillus udagawae]
MKPSSVLLFVSGAFALNPLLPVRIPNNTLVSEPTTDIVSDPLAKRWTCPSTCSTNICCDNGLCVWSLSDVCCGSYFCNSGEHCCGTGCMPHGAECCGVQGYCPLGERCMTVNGKLGCCPNGNCAQANAVNHYTQTENHYTTAYHTTTYTGVEWTWYSWTVTWTYWVTFYTYYSPVTASIRTSTVTTTSTIVSVQATDGSDASSSFTRLSATMSFYTPASATNPVTPTNAATASRSTSTSSGDDGSSSSNGNAGSNGGSGGNGGGAISVNGVMGGAGGNPNAANANRRLGWETVLSLSVVLGTGVLMVYL